MDIYEALKKFRKAKKVPEWRDCAIEVYREKRDYNSVVDLRRFLRKNVAEDPEVYLAYLKDLYVLTARDVFDDYMVAMEWERENKFYLPRRASLFQMVSILQDLADDKADIACISMPPGTGKSGVGLFYCSFLGGRDPVNGILTSSHKNQFLQGAYQEVLREVSSEEYNWGSIFPERSIAVTDAKNLSIGIDIAQRFNTFQFASLSQGPQALPR